MKKKLLNLAQDLKLEAIIAKGSKCYDHFNAEIKKQKIDLELKEILEKYSGKANTLLNEARGKQKQAETEFQAVQYPLYYNSDPLQKVNGNTEIGAAINFLSSKPSVEQIEQTLKMSLDLNRLDFISYVINSVINMEVHPEDYGMRKLQKELTVKKESLFPTLPEIQTKIDESKIVVDSTYQFLRAIENGYTNFVPEYYVRELDQNNDQVSITNIIDDINNSMNYWHDKNYGKEINNDPLTTVIDK